MSCKSDIQEHTKELRFGGTLLSNISANNIRPLLKLTVPDKERIEINVYDIQGRRVKEVVNKVFERGIYNIPVKVDKLPSGLYFVNVKGENKEHRFVKRFIKVN